MNQIKIGAFISDCRKAKGWTQNQLGEKLGITDKAVSKWETGASDPSTSNLIALANLYGVSSEELLGTVDGSQKGKNKQTSDVS